MQAKKNPLLQPEWIAAILITIAACVMHFYYWLHIGGLWRDEVNLLGISERHTFFDMARDSFPIMMPLIIHFWIASGLGEGDLGLRVIGLLVGLGILAALWVATWKIRRAPPLLGLVLFGLNDTLVFAGDSLRAYGLGSLLAVALTASAFVFLQKPSSRSAAWLVLFAVLNVQDLYHNAILVAAISFAAWAVCWRRKDGRAAFQVLLVAVIAAASLLPYLPNFFNNVATSRVLRTGVELPRFFASYQDIFGYPWPAFIYLWMSLFVVIIFSAIVPHKKIVSTPDNTRGKFPDSDLILFAAVVLTLETIGFPIFFWRSQLPMESWYLLPFMASSVVCFDAALAFRHWVWRVVLLIFAAVTACFSIQGTGRILKLHFSDVDLYTRQLTTVVAPKDYVLISPWPCGITFAHYFKGTTPWDTLPPISDHSVHRYDLVQLQLQNTNAITPVLRQIAQTLQSGHRVWILAEEGWMAVPAPGTRPPASLPPPPLRDTGWADSPYARVWANQIACFLAAHSTQFGKLKGLSSERFIAENMNAFVASGWKTNSSAP